MIPGGEGVIPLDEAVKKATDTEEVVPKRKHVRSIILDCWKSNSINALYAELLRRQIDKNAIVAFKVSTMNEFIKARPTLFVCKKKK